MDLRKKPRDLPSFAEGPATPYPWPAPQWLPPSSWASRRPEAVHETKHGETVQVLNPIISISIVSISLLTISYSYDYCDDNYCCYCNCCNRIVIVIVVSYCCQGLSASRPYLQWILRADSLLMR